MEKTFEQDIDDLKRFYKFTKEEMKLLKAVDSAAEEIAVPEFESYLKHDLNPKAIEIARKYELFRIPIKKEYGGLGGSPLIASLVQQRLGQLGLGFATLFDVQMFLCSQTIQTYGTEAQKKKYLVPAAQGKIILAFALTEPESGSEPTAMKTCYEPRGDKYLLNGTKYLISNGSIADALIVFAKSKENGSDITAFIVEKGMKGFSVAMQLKDKIGLFTSDTAMLEFDDVEVPKENVLGTLGKGMHCAYSALLNGRIGIASGCVGVIEGCLNASVDRARSRTQHGKLIGKHQLIQKHIAEIRQNLEMARWPTYFAAIRKGAYEADANDKALMKEVDMQSSLAKKIASRLAFESADHAVQIFGGFGYSLLSPVGQLFCDSRVARIYEGTDEIQELKIASTVLGDEFRAYS